LKRIYVAGPYSATDIIQSLENITRGQRVATVLLLNGYTPFCPFLDYQLFLQLRHGEHITKQQIRDYSLEWLKLCDAMVVLDGWENSDGTKREIEFAQKNGIPTFFSIDDFIEADNQ
jgi:nucleoside 2-deoxyribosyltransferase